MKQYFNKSELILLFLFTSLILVSCTQDNLTNNQDQQFKTVEAKDAMGFIKSEMSKLNRKSSDLYIKNVFEDFMSYEDISNSSELLVTIPVTTTDESLLSRIIMLDIDNEI